MHFTIKIISSILILFAFFMGLKQGWAMLSGKQAMMDMFAKWDVGKTGVTIFGTITILGALLMVFPKTFLWGNFIMAASMLLLIAFQLKHHDVKGALIELPFMLLSLLIIYLQHPLAKWN